MDKIAQYVENLPDGWTIYVWLIVAAMILIAAGFMLRWAAKNDQFDEDIKYVVFDKSDKDKMSAEEFQKSQDVMRSQTAQREENLAKNAEEMSGKNAKR